MRSKKSSTRRSRQLLSSWKKFRYSPSVVEKFQKIDLSDPARSIRQLVNLVFGNNA
jgi:hypothetical protein